MLVDDFSRNAFLNNFLAVFQVHCLKLWRQRSKEPPEILPQCLHEWIKTVNGRMDVDLAAFRLVVGPVVEDLHRKGRGARPTPEETHGGALRRPQRGGDGPN